MTWAIMWQKWIHLDFLLEDDIVYMSCFDKSLLQVFGLGTRSEFLSVFSLKSYFPPLNMERIMSAVSLSRGHY